MALFGNAHTVNPQSAQQDYARLLGHGEQVHAAFLLIRDTILVTDRRLILIDKQGRVYWAKHGGSPFEDFKFLSDELRRMNEKSASGPAPSVTARDK